MVTQGLNVSTMHAYLTKSLITWIVSRCSSLRQQRGPEDPRYFPVSWPQGGEYELTSLVFPCSHRHTLQVDTARYYCSGTSEQVLGEIAWQKRGIVMETKLYPSSVSQHLTLYYYEKNSARIRCFSVAERRLLVLTLLLIALRYVLARLSS